ncbi:MAG: hypothetical protein HY286_11600 [Planctomycetes bacterium]|nr:hypothetical protein [Planctomycetota bacterium]
MLAILHLCLLMQKATSPEAHVDFYTISTVSEVVELTVEAVAKPKDGPADAPAKKIVRIFDWHTGATTESDNSELARLVAEAMSQAGLDASSDGAETIIKNASDLIIKSNHWTALGAQVWATIPKDIKSSAFSITFEPQGPVGKASLVVGGAAKIGRPRVPEGDEAADGTGAAPTPPEPAKGKPGDAPKPPPKTTTPKPAAPKTDTKKKNPQELKMTIAANSDSAAIKELLIKTATAAAWKIEAEGNTKFKFLEAADGAPRWIYARFAGQGMGAIGIHLLPAAPQPAGPAKDPAKDPKQK